jgi:hypothetical protein
MFFLLINSPEAVAVGDGDDFGDRILVIVKEEEKVVAVTSLIITSNTRFCVMRRLTKLRPLLLANAT